MLVLAAGDTLAAGASAASQVTCTVFGMELNAGTEVYKVLDQRQLAASPATIYTVPASTEAFIKSILIENNDTVVRTFRMYRGGTAAANAITPTWSLLPGGCAIFQETLGWKFLNSKGEDLKAQGNIITTGGAPFYGLSGHLAENVGRNICPEANITLTATGQLWLQAIWLNAGMIVSNVSFHSATTAASAPTNWRFGLYDAERRKLAESADQLTAAWAAQTLKTLAVTPIYLVPRSGFYYCAFFMKATTVPTFKGLNGGNQLAGALVQLRGTSTPAPLTTLPEVAQAPAQSGSDPWCSVS